MRTGRSQREQVNVLREVAGDELQGLGPCARACTTIPEEWVSSELGMKEGALRGTRVQIVSVNDLSLPTLWGTALGSGSSSPGMAFLILQQAGIVDRTPFQSYQAQSGLPGWAQAQGQAESGRGLWEGPSMVPGRERTRLPKPLGSQCLKPCGREHCEETPPQWHQRRHTEPQKG